MGHKSGFVNIIGKPNVGKSTLMNAMVGEKLAIVTNKAQTTRHRIHGIVNTEDYQIVFSDTPGILAPAYKLQETMFKAAQSALKDADVIMYMAEAGESPDPENEFLMKLGKMKIPVLLVINKIDISSPEKLEESSAAWNTVLPGAEIIPVSALEKFNIEYLFKRITELLPEGPPFFDKEALTDKSERFFTGEIIREKILLNYKKEIPYSVEIEIESFKEEEDIIRIRALIYVERESQKGIIIGHKGTTLKKVGQESRLEMEQFFNKKVYLELNVKVKKDWRNNELQLKKFGYR